MARFVTINGFRDTSAESRLDLLKLPPSSVRLQFVLAWPPVQSGKGGAAEDAVPAFIEGAQGDGIGLGMDPVGPEVVATEVWRQVSVGDEVAHETV